MHKRESIQDVRDIFEGRAINLPETPGVYAFWWVGERSELLSSNRQIVLKGPGASRVPVHYGAWWPAELEFPCLYVGKSTNIKRRFSLHVRRKCETRLHASHPHNHKAKPATTSCQLRFGIEHVFPADKRPLERIFTSVGFSYRTDFPKENSVAERFFEEDRLVGTWRPWFNIDTER